MNSLGLDLLCAGLSCSKFSAEIQDQTQVQKYHEFVVVW